MAERLGPQQYRILLLMVWLKNEEIADLLGVAESTVRARVKRIYKVLHVPRLPNFGDMRLAAVVIALREGIITLEDLWRGSHHARSGVEVKEESSCE